MVKFQVETLLACDAAMYIADKDTPVYKKFHVRIGAHPRIPLPPSPVSRFTTRDIFFFRLVTRHPREPRVSADPTTTSRAHPQMEKLGTLESEVLSHEVVDGRVKVVVRTVPGMKLPRVVRPVLRGKEVEFVDTRTFLQRDKGKLPFAQTFRTVNNITERASVAGTIVIDRAPVPVSPDAGDSNNRRMMMGTVIRVQGECVVRIAGLGGKVESIIVQNLKNAYKKLPEIVHEWVATRETRFATSASGFASGFASIPVGIQPAPSRSATSVATVVLETPSVTSPRLIRASSVESEGSDSGASFHSADSFPLGDESARDDGREEGWGGGGGDAWIAGAASNGSSERYPQTPSFAASGKPPLPPPRGAANDASATPVGSLLSPHAFESDSPLETPEFFRASPGTLASRALTGPSSSGAFLASAETRQRAAAAFSPVHGMDTRQIQERDPGEVDGEGDIDSADERTNRALRGRWSRERREGRSANASNVARLGSGLPLDSSDSLGDFNAGLEQDRGKKGGSLSAVARWCCCAPGQPGSPLLDDIAESPAASDNSLRSLSSSPGADDAADAATWSPADDADLRTPLTPGTKTKRRSRR